MNVTDVFRDADKHLHQKIKVEGWLEFVTTQDGKRYVALKAKSKSEKYLLVPLSPLKYLKYDERTPTEELHEQFLKLFESGDFPLTRDEAAHHLQTVIEEQHKRAQKERDRYFQRYEEIVPDVLILDENTPDLRELLRQMPPEPIMASEENRELYPLKQLDVFCQIGLLDEFDFALGGSNPTKQRTVENVISYTIPWLGQYPGYMIGVLDYMESMPGQLLLKNITEAAFEHPDYTCRIGHHARDLAQAEISNRSVISVLDVVTAKEKYVNQIVHLEGTVVCGTGHYLIPHQMYVRAIGRQQRQIRIFDKGFQSKYNTGNFSPILGDYFTLSAEIRVVGKIIEDKQGNLALTDIEAAVTNDNGGLYIWKL